MIENLPGEIWKDIPGFEKYRVSNMGRVGSLMGRGGEKRPGSKSAWFLSDEIQSILAGTCTRDRYHLVILMKDKKRYGKKVHTLVMLAFVGERPIGLVVCHKDGNSLNNKIDNLRYDTQKNNMLDAVEYNNGVTRQSTINKEIVIKIREMIAGGYDYAQVAKKLGFGYGLVRAAAIGETYQYLPGASFMTVGEAKRLRNEKIKAYRKWGFTLARIGKMYGLTRSAVSLICAGKRGA